MDCAISYPQGSMVGPQLRDSGNTQLLLSVLELPQRCSSRDWLIRKFQSLFLKLCAA